MPTAFYHLLYPSTTPVYKVQIFNPTIYTSCETTPGEGKEKDKRVCGGGGGGSAGAGAGSIITSIPSPWTHEINHIVIVYILFLALQSDFTILFSLCKVSL